MPDKEIHIAFFVSYHGFGHASRASAIMDALWERNKNIIFDIVSDVPEWFFHDSLSASYNYFGFKVDVGFVQRDPFTIDMEATVRELKKFYPLRSQTVSHLKALLRNLGAVLVISDISPLGIAVSKEAGITSCLVENFTWDWLYEPYVSDFEDLSSIINYLKGIFNMAGIHIQAEPVCEKKEADLSLYPVSRKAREQRDKIKNRLKLSSYNRIVLVTMGGVQGALMDIEPFKEQKEYGFVICGISDKIRYCENIVLLPQRSPFYHPDLVGASDIVVGKAGYSTISELYYARIPFVYIAREDFRESITLISFIEKNMPALRIEEDELFSLNWLEKLKGMEDKRENTKINHPNGADQIAKYLIKRLSIYV